jgi:hypothetical protein
MLLDQATEPGVGWLFTVKPRARASGPQPIALSWNGMLNPLREASAQATNDVHSRLYSRQSSIKESCLAFFHFAG